MCLIVILKKIFLIFFIHLYLNVKYFEVLKILEAFSKIIIKRALKYVFKKHHILHFKDFFF